MGSPSVQIRCKDLTAAAVLDEAVMLWGDFVERETRRYAEHVPPSSGKDKHGSAASMEEVTEYHRALVEGTKFLDPRRAKRRNARKAMGRIAE